MKYIVVGNSAAAIGAVEGIRRVDQEGEITLISNEPYHTYSRPLISYYLFGKVTPEKMYYRDLDFYKRMKVKVKLGEQVKDILPDESVVVLATGERLSYDRLMIGSGGKPILPPFPGKDLDGVFSFHKWEDVKNLEKKLSPGVRTLVIGAGLIGLKATEALVNKEAQVKVVELSNRVLSAILDEDAAKIIKKTFEQKGVNFYLNNTVEEILGIDGKVSGVRLQDGSEISCDLVIIAIGVTPNTDLVDSARIKINKGILIDERMLTSCDCVYAAGDVAEGYDIIMKEQRVIPILPNAYKQGFIAGLNMAGEKANYRGGFAMNSIGFFDLPMITAGIVKAEGPDFTIIVTEDRENNSYKKVVLRDGKIVGFIALNRIDRAGILTGLMEYEVDVTSFQECLLLDDFGYIHFSEEFRKERLVNGGISDGGS